MTFGERLRELRKQSKMSQRDLADAIGVTRVTISSFERDITQPKFEQIKPLVKALHISTDDLFGVDPILGSDKWIINFIEKDIAISNASGSLTQKIYAICVQECLDKLKDKLKKGE